MSKPDLIKKTQIFSKLDDEQLKAIGAHGEERKIKEGELVFEEGKPGEAVYLLVDGRVQITIEMSHATEQAPVHTVVPGRVFGEFALVGNHDRSATARATKDCTIFRLSREAFLELAEEDPRLGYAVLWELSQVLVGRLIKTTRELRASLMF